MPRLSGRGFYTSLDFGKLELRDPQHGVFFLQLCLELLLLLLELFCLLIDLI